MSVDDLVSVVPPPPGQPRDEVAWPEVERQLGSALPADYKELVSRYGQGYFDEFIHIYQPFNDLPAIDLVTQAGQSVWALKYLRDQGEPMPYRLEDPAELLSFGRTDNGDVMFWHRTDLDAPDIWPVVVKEPRGRDWYEFPGGMSEFLAAALAGTIEVSAFPEDFPSSEPSFEPY